MSEAIDTSRGSAGRDLLEVGVLVFGFAWLVRSASSAITQCAFVWAVRNGEFAGKFAFPAYGIRQLVFPLVNLLIAVLAITCAEPIARMLLPREPGLTGASSTRARELFYIAIKLVGVVTVVISMNWLYGGLMDLLHVGEAPTIAVELNPMPNLLGPNYRPWNDTIQAVTLLGIGIYLATGARHLVDLAYGSRGATPDTDS